MKRLPLFIVYVLTVVFFGTDPSFAQTDKDDIMQFRKALEFVPEQYRPLYHIGLSGKEVKQLKSDLGVISISMKRSGCFGKCPVYELTLNVDETARYNGRYWVEKKGSYTGKISIRKFGRLCYLIDQMQFDQFDNRYAAPWTDDAGFTIKVNYSDGTHKYVTSYGGLGPIELWGLSKTIDAIADKIEWEKTTNPPSDQ